MNTSASDWVGAGIGGIALLVAAAFVGGLRRAGASPRMVGWTAAAVLLWLAVSFAAARSGLLARFDARPPPLAALLVASVAVGAYVGLSRVGEALARGLPLALLVGAHAFRLPLELVMHRAATLGVMPVQMSYSGYNFDIVSGVGAIIVSLLLAAGAAPRWLVVLWNAVGALLLLVIATIAAVSTPFVHAFGTEPARLNTFVAYAPFVWLPSVLVAAALAGHIVVARRLATLQ